MLILKKSMLWCKDISIIFRQYNTLSLHQKNLICGTLLGDSSLQTYTNGNIWRYRVLQRDERYAWHKYNILSEYCSTEPKKK
jgi:hypothetical protein